MFLRRGRTEARLEASRRGRSSRIATGRGECFVGGDRDKEGMKLHQSRRQNLIAELIR
jgi:hypothetical protein